MNKRPTLLFLNGPVGVGKSTLAQKYVDNHKLALHISADIFVGSMGQWLQHENEARHLALDYVALVARKHLTAGYDVAITYLLTDPQDMEVIERIATDSHADLCEVALIVPKEEAIARALERGAWGEPGSPPLTETDTPILEELFDKFHNALKTRPKSIHITVEKGNVSGTYRSLLAQVN